MNKDFDLLHCFVALADSQRFAMPLSREDIEGAVGKNASPPSGSCDLATGRPVI